MLAWRQRDECDANVEAKDHHVLKMLAFDASQNFDWSCFVRMKWKRDLTRIEFEDTKNCFAEMSLNRDEGYLVQRLSWNLAVVGSKPEEMTDTSLVSK